MGGLVVESGQLLLTLEADSILLLHWEAAVTLPKDTMQGKKYVSTYSFDNGTNAARPKYTAIFMSLCVLVAIQPGFLATARNCRCSIRFGGPKNVRSEHTTT